jgi:predicted ribosome quality control (RQC) complex YloA/Tae2 family protein
MKKKIIFPCFIIILYFSVLSAETIILRNGKAIQGKVLGHDSESVTVNIDGNVQSIPKSNVYKVIFSSNKNEISKYTDKKIKIEDEDFDETADKKELTAKLTQLEKKIDKLEKKITRLRERITKLRMKIKEKQAEESRTQGKS